MPGAPRPLTQRQRAYRLRDENFSITEIAEQLGIPRSTIGDWLKGEGEFFRDAECVDCGAHILIVSSRKFYCEACSHERDLARVRAWHQRTKLKRAA